MQSHAYVGSWSEPVGRELPERLQRPVRRRADAARRDPAGSARDPLRQLQLRQHELPADHVDRRTASPSATRDLPRRQPRRRREAPSTTRPPSTRSSRATGAASTSSPGNNEPNLLAGKWTQYFQFGGLNGLTADEAGTAAFAQKELAFFVAGPVVRQPEAHRHRRRPLRAAGQPRQADPEPEPRPPQRAVRARRPDSGPEQQVVAARRRHLFARSEDGRPALRSAGSGRARPASSSRSSSRPTASRGTQYTINAAAPNGPHRSALAGLGRRLRSRRGSPRSTSSRSRPRRASASSRRAPTTRTRSPTASPSASTGRSSTNTVGRHRGDLRPGAATSSA